MAQTFNNTPQMELLQGGGELAAHTLRLSETVALIQNSINDEEKKISAAAVEFSKLMFQGNESEIHRALVDIAEMKGKIQAYKDCSDLILDKLSIKGGQNG